MYFPTSDIAILAVVVNEDKEVLLLKQNHISNYYVLVAGYYKPGETIENTVVREIREETGVIVDSIKYLGSNYYEKKNALMFAFYAETINKKITIDPNEVDLAKWVKIDEAVKLVRVNSIGQTVLKYVRNHFFHKQ